MRQNNGFTLIELLVVMAIMSITIAIVAPLSQDQVAKSHQVSEWLSVQDFIGTVSKRAFLHGEVLQIELNGGLVRVTNSVGAKLYELHYNHVFFQPKTVVVNANGVLSDSFFVASVGKKQMQYQYVQFADVRN